jgi:hypothetical protein
MAEEHHSSGYTRYGIPEGGGRGSTHGYYTAQDLSFFSKGLKAFEAAEFFSYTGLYLSAMTNNAREDEITLQVPDIGNGAW